MPVQYFGGNQRIIDSIRRAEVAFPEVTALVVESLLEANAHEPKSTILVDDGLSHIDLFKMIGQTDVRHLVQISHPNFSSHLLSSVAFMANKNNSFEGFSACLGMSDASKYLSLAISPSVEKKSISDQKQLRSHSDRVRTFLKENDVPQITIDTLLLITHELVSNAVFDAPFYFERLFQREAQNPGHGIIGEFYVAVDSERAFIGASDAFGSLNMNKMIGDVILALESGRVVTIDNKRSHGAGIGCGMMFESLVELFFAISPQKSTIVGGTLPLRKGLKYCLELPKSFHYLR
jgi:hypothetical protein